MPGRGMYTAVPPPALHRAPQAAAAGAGRRHGAGTVQRRPLRVAGAWGRGRGRGVLFLHIQRYEKRDATRRKRGEAS